RSSRYSRDEPLTSTRITEINDEPKSHRNRSNSLDRLNSTYPSNTPSNRLAKYNSTNNIDNASETYTANSLNSTSISVREAKSRSFLVGSLSALNGKGLLSTEELDRHFLDRKARVLIASWNMGGVKRPPKNLDQLVLPDVIQTVPDVLVLGVQEFDLNQ
ncbi:72 kDa inositol polyphosphate 5-phosphatase, partial [Brachionus plicatilis]